MYIVEREARSARRQKDVDDDHFVVQASVVAMTQLFRHRRRLKTLLPDLSYVMKYTDQGPHPGNHWFWKTGRRDHGHDEHGQAYLRWRVQPCAASGYKTHGEFTVARLQIEHRQGPIAATARYENTCGLSQCINPDHWALRTPPSPWRCEALDHGAWQLVRVATGEPADRIVAVHVRFDGVVHVATILPADQRDMGLPRGLCGIELPVAFSVVTASPVTCPRCV